MTDETLLQIAQSEPSELLEQLSWLCEELNCQSVLLNGVAEEVLRERAHDRAPSLRDFYTQFLESELAWHADLEHHLDGEPSGNSTENQGSGEPAGFEIDDSASTIELIRLITSVRLEIVRILGEVECSDWTVPDTQSVSLASNVYTRTLEDAAWLRKLGEAVYDRRSVIVGERMEHALG